jgi:hypothetical protein
MLVLAVAAEGARAECKPTAVAEGDPALVETLITRLTASGVATTATSGCPVVQVRLEMRGQQVHVHLTDAFNRGGERDVQDVATAAAIVESWTLQEIDAGVLPAEPAVRTSVDVPVVATRHLVRHGVSASVMSALGSNGTTWVGGSISACLRVGPLCAGMALRGESDTRATGDTATVAQDSYVLSALATVDLPRKLGGFVVSPGIGLGYGYLHVVTHHRDAMNNPLDIPTADHQLRTGAHVALLHVVVDHVSAFADLWGDVAPARTDSQFGPGGSLRLSFGIRIEAL